MPKIFISYRRNDSEDIAGRIYDRLIAHFGKDSIFFDVDAIPYGEDLRDYINASLDQCQVVLAVIGRTWLTVTDDDGNRRIDNPADWVRLELEEALKRKGKIIVIPLLVSRASMPRVDSLPPKLIDLAYRNAAQARPNPDFHTDINRLIEQLKGHFDALGTAPNSKSESSSERRNLATESPVDSATSSDIEKLDSSHNQKRHTSFQLRPYQVDLINDLYRHINEGKKRIAIVAPYGSGKKVIGGQICVHAQSADKHVLLLVSKDVSVSRIYDKMNTFGLKCGFIKAGWKENRKARIQIASIQTMTKRRWWKQWPVDVVFYFDGASTLFSQVGKSVFKSFPDAVHLVVAATTDHLGKEQLSDYVDAIVAAPVPRELQRMSYLATMKYYSMPPNGIVDLREVKSLRGDYNKVELKDACDRPELIQKIVFEWQRLCSGKRTIAFCVDIEHARHVADAFHAAGIAADTLEGGMSVQDRKRMYNALREKDIFVLTSYNLDNLGFDEPSVEVGLMMRPTQLSALHMQQIGWVMSVSPQTGKQYGIILDQVGNLDRLGFPEDIKAYNLLTKKNSGDSGSPLTKHCPQCGCIVLSFVSQCPNCNYQWIIEHTHTLEDMVEIYSIEKAHQINDISILISLFHTYRRQAYLSGYSLHWAEHIFTRHCGQRPKDSWFRGAVFGLNPSAENMSEYLHYLQNSSKRLGKRIDWIVSEFEKEFGLNSFQSVVKPEGI